MRAAHLVPIALPALLVFLAVPARAQQRGILVYAATAEGLKRSAYGRAGVATRG